jgi:hypothetical protein
MRSLLIAALLASPMAHAQISAETINNPAPGVTVTPGGPAAVTPDNTVLFANGTFISQPTGGGPGGADALSVLTNPPDTSFGSTCFTGPTGFRLADNFTVPAGGWAVQQVNVFGYQTQAAPGGSTVSPFTGGTLQIWNGPPNVAGSTVVFGDATTNRMASTGFSGAWRVSNTTLTNVQRPISRASLTVNQVLQPGTYWIDYTVTVATGTAFCPPNNTTSAANNGLQFNTATAAWAAATDGGSLRPLDFPFEIVGTPPQPTLVSTPVNTLSDAGRWAMLVLVLGAGLIGFRMQRNG